VDTPQSVNSQKKENIEKERIKRETFKQGTSSLERHDMYTIIGSLYHMYTMYTTKMS
jgi:hypothetical protein